MKDDMSLPHKRLRYLNDLIGLLIDDPDADSYHREYAELPEYIYEMIYHKNGKGFLYNLIGALEQYLEK